jgi:glycolate oxidase iron-sulfur subunit
MACVTACPSGVRYDHLIEHARTDADADRSRSPADRLYRELIFAMFPYPKRLEWIARGIRLAQRSGVQQAFRKMGLAALLPARLAALERMTPRMSDHAPEVLPEFLPAVGRKRARVGLLLGCVQRVFFPDVNAATARVLTADGCDVVVPKDQQCCGALMLHAGRTADARRSARQMIERFDRSGAERVVINAAGCGSAMKDYGRLLADDPAYAERARAFSARCVDVSELLSQLEPVAARNPLALRVAYQDACHLSHAQGIRTPPRDLIRTVPGIELVEIPENDLCCGSAGLYSLLEPEASSALGKRKAQHIKAVQPDVLVSSNPGCLLQLAAALEAAGAPVRTMHVIQVLDASIRRASQK